MHQDVEDSPEDEITDPELRAMRTIERALAPFDPETQRRIIGAVAILYSVDLPGITSPIKPALQSAPAATSRPVRAWGSYAQRRRRRCRGCNAKDHDWRKCPLNFEVTIEVD